MLDVIIFLFFIFFVILGFFNGFRNEVKSLLNICIFFTLTFFYSLSLGKFIIDFFGFSSSVLPQFFISIIGFISSLIFSIFISHLISSVFFSVNNFYVDSLFGSIIGFLKGIVFLTLFLLFVNYYNYLSYIENIDNNSLFLEYFLRFGVQLQDVWNNWNS